MGKRLRLSPYTKQKMEVFPGHSRLSQSFPAAHLSYLANSQCKGHSFLSSSAHLPPPSSCQELKFTCHVFSQTHNKIVFNIPSESVLKSFINKAKQGAQVSQLQCNVPVYNFTSRNKPATKVPNQGPQSRVDPVGATREPTASQYQETVHPVSSGSPWRFWPYFCYIFRNSY